MSKKENHLPIKVRKELGEYAMRAIIRKNPELSIVQVRRIFCYTYFTLAKGKFEEFYNHQKMLVNEENN